MQSLYESLEREFCPPLDSSLLAALLAEIELDNGEQTPTIAQLVTLRSNLRELCSRAEQDELRFYEQLAAVRLSDDTNSTPELCCESSSMASESSRASQNALSLPLDFLQAALPQTSPEVLKAALDHSQDGINEIDMEAVIEKFLTDEYLRELEERGLDGDDHLDNATQDDRQLLQTVKSNAISREPKSGSKSGKRKGKNKKIITLGDVRQTRKVRTTAPLHEPWTQISSLSTHLASILPPNPPTFFQSYFHSPKYATPYQAVCAALTAIRAPQENESALLFDLLDILTPSYNDLNAEQRSRLVSDTKLALSVTHGRGEDTLDLVKFLRDLDSDSASDSFEMGLYHSLPDASVPVTAPKNGQLIAVPPGITQASQSPPPSPTKVKPNPFEWQSVPVRSASKGYINNLAASIPSYNNLLDKDRTIGKRDNLACRQRMQESMRKRNELLRNASKAWRNGNANTRGGEVAFYLAERARQIQEEAKRDSLEASRIMVESRRALSPDGSVDVHGATAAEAIIIVKEILDETGASPQKPLTIITGRGKHSVNGVSVLKPTVKNALIQDNWIVGTWDGGLTVRGKAR